MDDKDLCQEIVDDFDALVKRMAIIIVDNPQRIDVVEQRHRSEIKQFERKYGSSLERLSCKTKKGEFVTGERLVKGVKEKMRTYAQEEIKKRKAAGSLPDYP